MPFDGAAIWYFSAIDLWFGKDGLAHAEAMINECTLAKDEQGATLWRAFAAELCELQAQRRIGYRKPRSGRLGRQSKTD